MCGIFGFSLNKRVSKQLLYQDIQVLFKLSESRGVEASGIAVKAKDKKVQLFKKAIPAYEMSETKEFKQFYFKDCNTSLESDNLKLIAHSRLATNGVQANNLNNQPVSSESLICVHNGIITNVNELLEKHNDINIESELDTEILLKIINKYYDMGNDIEECISLAYNEIEGNANLAILDNNDNLILSTDNSSLYYIINENGLIFASEQSILKEYVNIQHLNIFSKKDHIIHLQPSNGLIVDSNINKFKFYNDFSDIKITNSKLRSEILKIDDYDNKITNFRKSIKRCTKCILPETMPFIVFDEKGECNYCKNYNKKTLLGKEKLYEELKKIEEKNNQHKLVFAFSGGRDSCYALHYYVKEFGLKPIAYSYDWGMITDLGRRNQSRLLGKLGIEHVLISADIRTKRENIRKNVEAWLKKPDLGMIPLIIAGDKQMLYYARQVQNQYNAHNMMFSANYFEQTDFKVGFANVNTVDVKGLSIGIGNKNKYAMMYHYLKNFINNPSYINSSLIDTFDAYKKYYDKSHNTRIEFFDYIEWDEDTVNNTLFNEYNWESSPDTPTTWRIGDGTAAFYNYIYHTVAGFTENDTFRSNQIREGVLTRDEALALIEKENVPRWQTIKEYCNMINVDFVRAIEIIDNIPKLYIKEL